MHAQMKRILAIANLQDLIPTLASWVVLPMIIAAK